MDAAQRLINASRARTVDLLLAAALRGRQIGVRRVVERDPETGLATGSVEVPLFEGDAARSDNPEIRALVATPREPEREMRQPGRWWAEYPPDEEDRDIADLLESNTDAVVTAADECGLVADRDDAETMAALAMLHKMRGSTLSPEWIRKTAGEHMVPKPTAKELRKARHEALMRRARGER